MGTNVNRIGEYRLFREAREFVRSLGLKNKYEWRAFCKGKLPHKGRLPDDIPTTPDKVYADRGWMGMEDWLEAGPFVANHGRWRPFEEARAFARSLGLKSQSEWRAFCNGRLLDRGRLPADIPATPAWVYIDKGWKGHGDWLGAPEMRRRCGAYRPFEEARAFARSLGLKSDSAWRAFCKGIMPDKGRRPTDIPAKPEKVYAERGWKSMGDWLGTGNIAPQLKVYRPFQEARVFARNLNLKNLKEWEAFCKGRLRRKGRLPMDIPATPSHVYVDKGWKGYGDWLGTGAIARRFRVFQPFAEARGFARSLGLKSRSEWYAFCRGKLPRKGQLPADIPASPSSVYADKGWKGYGDWLGTGRTRGGHGQGEAGLDETSTSA